MGLSTKFCRAANASVNRSEDPGAPQVNPTAKLRQLLLIVNDLKNRMDIHGGKSSTSKSLKHYLSHVSGNGWPEGKIIKDILTVDRPVLGLTGISTNEVHDKLEYLKDKIEERIANLEIDAHPVAERAHETEAVANPELAPGNREATDINSNNNTTALGRNQANKLIPKPKNWANYESYSTVEEWQDLKLLVSQEGQNKLPEGEQYTVGNGQGDGAKLVLLSDDNLAIVRKDGSGSIIASHGVIPFEKGHIIAVAETLITDATVLQGGPLKLGGPDGARLLTNSRNALYIRRPDSEALEKVEVAHKTVAPLTHIYPEVDLNTLQKPGTIGFNAPIGKYQPAFDPNCKAP